VLLIVLNFFNRFTSPRKITQRGSKQSSYIVPKAVLIERISVKSIAMESSRKEEEEEEIEEYKT